ncbi:hypothetical protein BGX38DRAFT_1275079 [Terfezia claveryi]|nr:hypothetical protein BGX38DRAFT_1275079 [Terfezia claveryi]
MSECLGGNTDGDGDSESTEDRELSEVEEWWKKEQENFEENFEENMEVWVDNDLVVGNNRGSGEGDEVDKEDEGEIEYGDIVYDLTYKEKSAWHEGGSFEVNEGEESMDEYGGDDGWVLEDSDSQAGDD